MVVVVEDCRVVLEVVAVVGVWLRAHSTDVQTMRPTIPTPTTFQKTHQNQSALVFRSVVEGRRAGPSLGSIRRSPNRHLWEERLGLVYLALRVQGDGTGPRRHARCVGLTRVSQRGGCGQSTGGSTLDQRSYRGDSQLTGQMRGRPGRGDKSKRVMCARRGLGLRGDYEGADVVLGSAGPPAHPQRSTRGDKCWAGPSC